MDQSDASRIATHEIIPGHLVVMVHEHSFDALEGPANCWTYVSHGLSRIGQKEVVLSVERETDEPLDDYPRAVLELFKDLHSLANEGRVVDVGSFTVLSPESPGLLGDARLRGIAYTPPERLVDVALPSSSITAVLLTQNELDAAMQFGLVRLMALLGFRYRYFPTAAWLVRGRPDVTSSPTEMSSSLLAKMSRAQVSKGHVYLRGIETHRDPRPPTGLLENSAVSFARQEVVLELSATPAADVSGFLRRCGQESALALLTCPDPDADACFVWMPGRPGNAITSPNGTGLRIAGNHVLFVPGQNHDEVRVVEDGFAVLVTNTTWHEMRQLLANAPQNWGLPASAEIGFRIKVSE